MKTLLGKGYNSSKEQFLFYCKLLKINANTTAVDPECMDKYRDGRDESEQQ